MSTLFTGFIHYKWGIVPPLLSQAVMGLSGLYSNPLVKIYFLSESLVRPWEQESESNFMQKMLQQYMDPPEEETETETTKKITQGEQVEENEEKRDEGDEEEEEGNENTPTEKTHKIRSQDLKQNGDITRNPNTSHAQKRSKGKKQHHKK